MESLEGIPADSADKPVWDARIIMAFALVASAAALATIYYSLMQIMDGGFGVTAIIGGAEKSATGYSQCFLELLMCPAGSLASGIVILITCAGVLLHFNWGRIGLIGLSIAGVILSAMAVGCVAMASSGPVDRVWHGFGLSYTERLIYTLIFGLVMSTLFIQLVKKLRSKEFKEYFC